ncbi:hypothetical protein MMC30_004237 [Trapelia coarctata]|nr:hypothetical protein [Trapelia coarctata]
MKRSQKAAQAQIFPGATTGGPAGRDVIIQQEALHSSDVQAEMAPLDKASLKQVNHFVRGHTFIQISLSGHTTSQRRAFERDVYDYARGLGLQRREAKREVLKARGFCGEFAYDSDVSMLGDEVDDTAQLLAALSGRPIAPQSTLHNASTRQEESMPTPKQTRSNGKRKSRVSDADPGTLSDAKAVEALSKLHLSRAAKKPRKRKAAEIEEEVPNALELSTPKEKSSRKKSQKSRDKSSAPRDVSQDLQPDDTKRVSHRRNAKRQKLEPTLNLLATAKDSAHDDVEQQPDAESSTISKKQKKEKKKIDNAGKRSKKGATLADHSIVEAHPSNEHGEGSSIKESKTAKTADQQRKNSDREARWLAKIERRRTRREQQIVSSKKRLSDAETRGGDSVEDRRTTSKPTGVALSQFPDSSTTSKHAESNRRGGALADPTEVPYASRGEVFRAATPEQDSLDQPDTGPEVRSVYFTPENQKSKRARSSPKVELEVLEHEMGSPKGDLERRKEAKEKQAKFRAEIQAATRRLSNAHIGSMPLQTDSLDASSNIVADTSGELSQSTPQIAETAKAVARIKAETTASTQPRHRKHRQSENMVDVISKEANKVEYTFKPLAHFSRNSDPAQPARKEFEEVSETRFSQLLDPAWIDSMSNNERAVQNDTQEDGKPYEAIVRGAIEPVIPESLPKHNGWMPINHALLSTTGQPRFRESCTVFGSIRKPEIGHGFMDVDGANQDLREDSTRGIDTPASSTGTRVLRRRKSSANVDGGAEETMVAKGTRKPRKATQEPLDFQSPMIHCTGEELSLKMENALSKMDLADTMLGGTGHSSEGLSVSNASRYSSPLSSLETRASPPAWLPLEERSAQEHEKTSEHEVPPLLASPGEQGEHSLLSAFTSFVPQALRGYNEIRPESPKGLFGLLIPPKSPPQIPLRPQHTARSSRFFPKPPAEKVSCIPFPPLDADSFGLVQERLCHEPFRLLIAVTFLNKTRGKVALPVCYELFERYPTPEDLANANSEELAALIGGLGLQNQRGKRMIKLAQMWVEKPPQKGQRYRRLHYPKKSDGSNVKPNEPISDDDPRVAWEIAHLPGTGAYAIDSWRIFCRDELRGLPTGLPRTVSPEAVDEELQKEWTRVLPLDKELRAYLRWRWLRLGWNWNPLTGERDQVEADFLEKLRGGGVSFEGEGHCAMEAVDSVMNTFDLGFSSDKQCGSPFPDPRRDDTVVTPGACGTVGGSQEALSTDEVVGKDPLSKGHPAETGLIVAMSQASVAIPQVDNLPKAVSSIIPNVVNGEQHETREDTGSETSHVIQAALSWLQGDDIEDTLDTARGIVGPEQAIFADQLAVERNSNRAEDPWLPIHNESNIRP